jgi:prepilin-type N-terminal cleavage/methylation domain-containing protein
MRTHRGFTIAELMVVVAIILLLIGLLLPALHGVQRRARVVKCLTNLRQIQLAHWNYIEDHRGYFIDVGLAHGGAGNESVAWVNTLQEYYDSKLVLHSPLDNSKHWPVEDGGDGIPVPGSTNQLRRTSYGCNNFLSRTLSPLAAIDSTQGFHRLSQVKNPARTVHFLIMAYTGEFAGADHVHVENWLPPIPNVNPAIAAVNAFKEMQLNAVDGPEVDRDAITSGTATAAEIGALRASTSNYGFLDGSASSLTFTDVFINQQRNRFNPDAAARQMDSRP